MEARLETQPTATWQDHTVSQHGRNERQADHRAAGAAGIILLAATLYWFVDASVIGLVGERVSYALPVLMWAGYITLGMVLLGLLKVAQPRRQQVAALDAEGRFRLAWLVGFSVVPAALVVQYGLSEVAGISGWQVPAAIVVMVVAAWAGAICVVRSRRRAGISIATLLAATATIGFVVGFWRIAHDLYRGPLLSLPGLFAQLGFFGTGLAIFLLLRRLLAGVDCRAQQGVRFSVGRLTLCTATCSLLLCCTLMWCRRPTPLLQNVPVGDAPIASAPSIIVVVMDTVRADRLSVYGYDRRTTPNLEQLADEAVVYTHAIAPSSWTLPSHASMLTGLMPTEHGVHKYLPEKSKGTPSLSRSLNDHAVTLAEVLADRGYRTGAILSNSIMLDRMYQLHQGFAHYDDRARVGLDTGRVPALSPANWVSRLFERIHGGLNDFRSAETITRRALAWLDGARDRPNFLLLNYMDAHNPHVPYDAYRKQIGLTDTAGTESDFYDLEIAYLDDQLGRLFDGLRTRGLFDDSLIVVTSDHGEAFGEHGHFGHAESLYQEEIHVPLLVRYPGGKVTGLRPDTVSLAAMMPLVLDGAGIDPSDMPPDNSTNRPHPALAELYHPKTIAGTDDAWISRAVIMDDRTKMIVDQHTVGNVEVFALSTDPYEQANLATQSMSIRTDPDHVRDLCASNLFDVLPADDAVALSEDELNRLRTFGYIQ